MKKIILFLFFSSIIFGEVFYTQGEVSYLYKNFTNACTGEVYYASDGNGQIKFAKMIIETSQ